MWIFRTPANTSFTDWRRDLLYSIEVQVGTPGQTVALHMDTGSSDTYVYDKACTAAACNEVNKFDHEKSSTFHEYNSSARNTLTYGSGFAYGYWSKDTVAVGGFSVPDQVFLSASSTDEGYRGTNVSGLIGFGWPDLSVSKENPFWYTAVQNWEDKRFGCFLERRAWNNPNSDPRPTGASPGGTLTLGGVDESLFSGEIKYYPVTEKRFWKIEFAGLDINGKSVNTNDQNKLAVIDTGSTLCYGPPDLVAQIYAAIPGSAKQPNSGYYNIPCDTKPDVSFKFGNDKYKIFATDFIHTKVPNTDNVCTGSLIAQQFDNFGWVIGDTLLKNVYSVFQYEPPAVGFAALAGAAQPPTECPPKRKRSTSTVPYWDENGKLAWRPAN